MELNIINDKTLDFKILISQEKTNGKRDAIHGVKFIQLLITYRKYETEKNWK